LSISPEPENEIDVFCANASLFEVVDACVDWYSILAVPFTERAPACAYAVTANDPAKAVRPIFFKFVIFTPIVIFVITNSVFLAK
jgi:hypothetical protein